MNNSISRRNFLAGAAASALAARFALASADAPSTNPVSPLEEFDFGAVRLTSGPLGAQYDRIHATYLALENDRLLKVYRQRAGMAAPGADMGGWYDTYDFVPGHSLGQYISGLARIARATGDQACRQKVADLVSGFAATLGPKDQVFAGPNAAEVWPCYILDKHLQALIDADTLTGYTPARELLPRVLHGALPYIPSEGRDRIGKKDPPYDETFIMPETLFAAHELTGEKIFLDRARAYMLDREFFAPLSRGQDVFPGQHAYSHAIALSSGGKAYFSLGDPTYLRALENAHRLLETTQQYATGGWGPNETFITPHRGELFASLHSTDDHFETPCGSYAAIKLSRYLLCATGDARYADSLERVVFNSLAAVKEPDGDGNFPYYSTYSDHTRKVFYPKKWPCCSGTLVEGVADYVKDIYFRSADGLAVVLYAPSELTCKIAGTALKLAQQTAYPLDGAVEFRIDPAAPTAFALRLRIPAWAEGKFTLTLNGKPLRAETEKNFALLRRTWVAGDRLRIEFPLGFRTESIDEQHPETAAVLRGPLVYVELNPQASARRHVAVDSLRPLAAASSGYFALGDRLYVPFYSVQNERYTLYATRG